MSHSESSLTQLLRATYEGEAYAVLAQVRNGTGFGKVTRTADAIVASLWPSRGLWVGGYEIKCSRSDWLNEVKDPSKANEIGRHLHHWTVITADETLIKLGELPAAWGWMVPDKKGEKLRTLKEPQHRPDAVPEWGFIAAVLRAAAGGMVPKACVAAEIAKGELALREELTNTLTYRLREERDTVQRSLDHLQKSVDKFEHTTGLRISDYSGYSWRGDNSKAIEFVQNGGLKAQERELEELAERAESVANAIRAAMTAPMAEPDFSI